MTTRNTWLALAALAWLLPGAARAENPIQVAIWHPIQYVEDTESVEGFRFCLLYGINHHVTGADLTPLAARATGDMRGLALGMYTEVRGEMVGVQGGAVALVEGTARGIQGGFLYNQAREMRGLQISLINRTDRLDGVQFGLLNFNEAGPLKFTPFLNVAF